MIEHPKQKYNFLEGERDDPFKAIIGHRAELYAAIEAKDVELFRDTCRQDVINQITGIKCFAELCFNYPTNNLLERWKNNVVSLAGNCQPYINNLNNFIDSQTWFDSSTSFTQNSIDPKSSNLLSIDQEQGIDSNNEFIDVYNKAIDAYYEVLARLGYKENLSEQVSDLRSGL